VARTSPIAKLKDTVKESLTATQGAVGQAVDVARGTVDTVAGLVPGRKPAQRGARRTEPPATGPLVEAAASRKVQGDALAPETKPSGQNTVAKKTVAKKTVGKKAPAKKSPAKKVPAKKAPARKTAAKKTVAKKSTAKRTPAKKTATKKTAAKKSASKGTAAKP
jgi:hypothetical protein